MNYSLMNNQDLFKEKRNNKDTIYRNENRSELSCHKCICLNLARANSNKHLKKLFHLSYPLYLNEPELLAKLMVVICCWSDNKLINLENFLKLLRKKAFKIDEIKKKFEKKLTFDKKLTWQKSECPRIVLIENLSNRLKNFIELAVYLLRFRDAKPYLKIRFSTSKMSGWSLGTGYKKQKWIFALDRSILLHIVWTFCVSGNKANFKKVVLVAKNTNTTFKYIYITSLKTDLNCQIKAKKILVIFNEHNVYTSLANLQIMSKIHIDDYKIFLFLRSCTESNTKTYNNHDRKDARKSFKMIVDLNGIDHQNRLKQSSMKSLTRRRYRDEMKM
ncbi:hypothetical protein BpHYR1_021473 [Brachionus plicatilis]|uniref:Uncharacterized protein n=1 Tax=Brachionus plicatilis TaxID=10195 RepID=A0A3M7R8J1_BRAPC|nr:hypothetical protein BpHYR1_021473 [Brachionus plicatilis]